jgi:hypothetical protein
MGAISVSIIKILIRMLNRDSRTIYLFSRMQNRKSRTMFRAFNILNMKVESACEQDKIQCEDLGTECGSRNNKCEKGI